MLKQIKEYIFKRKIIKEGGNAFSKTLRRYYQENFGISVGYGSYGGCFNHKLIPSGTQFGNYCSIGENLYVSNADHPYNYFSTHPLFYNPKLKFVKEDKLDRSPLIVGNDVWIGQNVIILKGCSKIGNGSIIGAGSIVTKDIPSYSIYAGNPAKLIKMRFEKNIIDNLEREKWWSLEKDDLIRKIPYLEKLTTGIKM